jgi:hypothetical protein
MPDILLATLNAKYIHASFGLRSLRANLGELRERSALLEFNISQRPLEIAEQILARQPKIVGLGVYIWNVTLTTELVALLKRINPSLTVVLGGPEVSHETEGQEIVRLADYTITGEGEQAFATLCRRLLAGDRASFRIQRALPPPIEELVLPYEEYLDEDIQHRLIYVEASRGCPFECDFCLSSLDERVRAFALEPFLQAMERLLSRGVLHFKFVDRTFNLNLNTTRRIMEFFLERLRPGLFLHFEMVPDRLPEGLRDLILRFPAGVLQFEVGIQTFNAEVAANINRRQDYAAMEDNFRFLREQTGVHVHADLIVGLPGETEAMFGAGFDRLVGMGPQEIQVGILKRLRGAPIARHDQAFDMVYSPFPSYEILRNKDIDFSTMQRLRRFARTWELLGNSGNFVETTPLLWLGGGSPFAELVRFSEWYLEKEGRHHAIALVRSMERVFEYLTQQRGLEAVRVAASLWRDYQRGGRGEMPPFLRTHLPHEKTGEAVRVSGQQRTTLRQLRHGN